MYRLQKWEFVWETFSTDVEEPQIIFFHFNKLESTIPKNALSHIWLKFTKKFMSSNQKCKNLTTTRTTDRDQKSYGQNMEFDCFIEQGLPILVNTWVTPMLSTLIDQEGQEVCKCLKYIGYKCHRWKKEKAMTVKYE